MSIGDLSRCFNRSPRARTNNLRVTVGGSTFDDSFLCLRSFQHSGNSNQNTYGGKPVDTTNATLLEWLNGLDKMSVPQTT